MKTHSKKHQTILGAFLVVAIVLTMVWDRIELPNADQRVKEALKETANLTVTPLEPTEAEKEILGSALVAKNVYQARGEQFLVIVLDGSSNRQAVHDPRHCFHSGGWTIESESHFDLPQGNATHLYIRQRNQQTGVLYWYSDGQQQHSSPWQYWLTSTLRRLTFGYSGDEQLLVLVQKVTPVQVTNWETLFAGFPGLFRL